MTAPDLSYPHRVTLWRITGRSDFGDPVFAVPLLRDARWSDRAVLFRDPSGRESVSRSVVAIKDAEIAPGDFLLFGVSAEATPPEGADEIRQISDVDSIDGTWTRRRAFL